MFRRTPDLACSFPRALVIAVSLLPSPALAQTGLGSPAGGFFVLLLVAVLSLIGFGMLVTGAVLLFRGGPSFWRVVLLLLGLASVSPALWFAFFILGEFIPRNESWDFSVNRSVSVLGAKVPRSVGLSDRDAEYSYQGNIRSTIKLPSGRQWSGAASLVVLEALGGQITGIDWQGEHANASQIYEQTKRILRDLKMTGHDLDSWYAKSRGKERIWFSFESETDLKIRVDIRGLSPELEERDPETRLWMVNVNVQWKNAGQ